MKKTLISIVFIIFCSIITTAQTAGTLTVSFTEVTKTGCYTGSDHVLAAWIDGGAFIKTKLRYCCTSNTNGYLNTWGQAAGATLVSGSTYDASTGNVVDATTGATLHSFITHNFTWDGTDASGVLVPDGLLALKIQTTWNTGAATVTRSMGFLKNATGSNQSGATAQPNDTQIKNISIVWTPTVMATEEFTENPTVKIYPNPSNTGVFNLDFKNEVNSIKVMDVLGKVVFNENLVTATTGITKSIDLSNLTNGVYFINTVNDKGSTNYKVILDK